MTQSAPWRGALKRAGATSRAGAAALPPQPTSTFAPNAGSIDATAVSPHLAALLNEREQLQAKRAALTGPAGGGGMSGRRYAVAGITERRVYFQRWADARDVRRSPVKRDSERPR